MIANKCSAFGAGLLSAVILAACGGTGGGSAARSGPTSAPPVAPPVSTVQTIATSGAVTEVSATKLTVGGIAFDTASATVTRDGVSASTSQFKVGDVVSVTGRMNDDRRTGTATRVEFDDDVEGPIKSIDVAAGVLVVLGQRVRIDAMTLFDDSTGGLPTLVVGQTIEVSGFRNAAGEVVASRIEVRGARASELEVTGIASAVDPAQKRLTIGLLVVDYSAATLSNFPSGAPQNGDRVEAKGNSLAQSGALIATRLERKAPLGAGDDLVRIAIEGLIGTITSPTEFEIAGRRVRLAPNVVVEFEDGIRIDLATNAKVEVEGTLGADGVLVVSKISIRAQPSARLTARLDAVDSAAGTVRILGAMLKVAPTARLRDQSDARLPVLRLADLAAGDYVEVRGAEVTVAGSAAGSERMLVLMLERQRPADEVRVRGRASNVARPEFQVLGIRVVTQAGTRFEGVSADDFFAQASGKLVSAKGTASGAIVTAREVEFE
jgi:Domain of unknown function (DUF5666)